MTKPSSGILSALTSILLSLFLLSGAIAVPILSRPFYYVQIHSLNLPEKTGFSPQVIRDAYDQVMDYLLKEKPFATGELKWSYDGMRHFADCRVLFRLDFVIFAVSVSLLLLILVSEKAGWVRLRRFLGQGPCFWALVATTAFLLILGSWAAVNFESFFTAFHTILFPGRTNWIFDWRTDEIILILPEEFWVRAGALVCLLALGGGALLAALERFLPWGKPKNVYEQLRAQRKGSTVSFGKSGRQENPGSQKGGFLREYFVYRKKK